MPPPDSIRPEDFPDSAYADELRSGISRLRFAPGLEIQYQTAHLQRVRLRVRVWFSFAATVAFGHLLARLLGFERHAQWAAEVFSVLNLALAALIWSPGYLRWYMPIARVLLPLLAAGYAVYVAQSIVAGQPQQLAMLTMMVIVFFSFAGMLFRSVLVTTVTMLVTFGVSLALLGPMNALAVQSLLMLTITVVLCVIVYRDIERGYRRTFIERALIGELVARDELTGLTNRRAFYEHLQRVWQQAQRDRCAIALLMIDIDHFKVYNDTHGHQAGDAALRTVGQILRGFTRRPLDLAARYGGDEFVAVLYDLAEDSIEGIAERLRQAVHAASLSSTSTDVAGSASGAMFTVSVGVGAVMPTLGRSMQGAVQLADEALYEAKQAGRNRVVARGNDYYRRLDTGSFRKSAATS